MNLLAHLAAAAGPSGSYPVGLVAAVEAAGSAPDYGNIVAFLSGLAALASVAITSLRKRKDVSVEEMRQRIKDQDARIDELEDDLAVAQASALAKGRDCFLLRTVLADRGIPDPTTTDEATS